MMSEFNYVTNIYSVLTGYQHGVSEMKSLKGHPGWGCPPDDAAQWQLP